MSDTQKLKDFLEELIRLMKLDAEVNVEEAAGSVKAQIEGEDSAILIGKEGHTLESLQFITSIALNKGRDEDRVRYVIDVGDYKERRIENIKDRAQGLAKEVSEKGEPVNMEPMNSYERRAIHMALRESTEVMTESQGEGPERHIVIKPL